MDMDMKALSLVLLVSAALLLSGHQPASAQVFCRSQFNLANEACSLRNFIIPGPGVRRGGLPRQQKLNETATSTTSTADASSGAVGSQGMQSQSSDDDDDDRHGGRRSGRHRHQHRHSEAGEGLEDPRDTACCRRLMGLDNSCVCQATSRLPPFMNAVRHVITLTPVEGCEISFECPGPLI